jgi:hypothetical protein
MKHNTLQDEMGITISKILSDDEEKVAFGKG